MTPEQQAAYRRIAGECTGYDELGYALCKLCHKKPDAQGYHNPDCPLSIVRAAMEKPQTP